MTFVMRGAMSGLLAVVPMTCAMLLGQRLLPRREREPLEPRQISDAIVNRVGTAEPGEDGRRATAWAGHFAYGAAVGSMYPAIGHLVGQGPLRGAGFGLAVYMLSYAGWLPAMGILPPPQRRPRGRNLLLMSAHVVWGVALDISSRRLQARAKSSSRCLHMDLVSNLRAGELDARQTGTRT